MCANALHEESVDGSTLLDMISRLDFSCGISIIVNAIAWHKSILE